ncbi:P-II family nitrogen regulator [Inconstantimicrobium mannanitabidum]|uniref:Nitrogen regulatory protein P-II n=1 Tax=Inconstantimicrobium mannanitabidum TaxID=1604901 RepID=A0ACB5R7M1_9CLOT|nr:P-II family nitrogen regulator [Clostridium sp. TW13]GKX65027.1 nitrogen regulatory protein P-II [Clostridium sp. TW13]
MKKIEAIIRPDKLEELKEALQAANVHGITIRQVLGCGNQHGWTEYYRSNEVLMNLLPKVELKIVANDSDVENIVSIIISIAKTGEVGDGKIFISDICECIRIRTEERGPSAI